VKIGLIIPANIKYAPYVQYYLQYFDQNGITYEVISWNKFGINEDVAYSYFFKVNDKNLIYRIIGYIGYAAFVHKILKFRKYDGIIIFTIAPAILMHKILVTKYSRKFIFDIRDDSKLRHIFSSVFKELIANAYVIVSSSPEYKKWIGRDVIICHNVDMKSLHDNEYMDYFRITKPYRIMFAGSFLLEWDTNLKMLRKIGNSKNIKFIFYGPESNEKKRLEKFVEKNMLTNTSFFGTYNKKDIYKFYREKADVVNIIRKRTIVNQNALPNKFYDAVVAGKPIVVFSHNTVIVNYVREFNLGFIITDDNFKTFEFQLIMNINNFDCSKYISGRHAFIKYIENDYRKFCDILSKWLNDIL
jgi:hypothetical protein